MKNRNNFIQSKAAPGANNPRAGFTLIEMIVSVALVLLMMLMFTEIFQILSESMTTQRGISENDQRERLLVTVLQADLDHRTFQYLQPFAADTSASFNPLAEDPRSPEFHHHDRQGYFYISENDPNDDTDDLLQFTVSRYADSSQEDGTGGYYYGHANIDPYYPNNTPYIGTSYRVLSQNPNQPDADDGRIEEYDTNGNLILDFTAKSSAAEVSYFLRGGNLYRRVMLIREPLNLSTINSVQPTAADGTPYFERGGTAPLYGEAVDTRCDFWRDLDFSAFRDTIGTPYARFHSIGSLQNFDSTGSFPLGFPRHRFGFNHVDGLSREYVTSSVSPNPELFMGRFTHEETSHVHFNYPHDQMHSSIGGGGNPMDPTDPSLTMNPDTRIITDLEQGIRRSEDLVLSNVRSFDIKVFDDLAGAFVDLGGDNAVRFASGARENTDHGNSQYQNVFDTWHWSSQINSLSGGGNVNPPFPMLTDSSGNPVYDISTELPRPASSPLRALRILVRYEDPTSGQIRQMTLIHPLRSKGE